MANQVELSNEFHKGSDANFGRRPNFSMRELNALVSGVEKNRDVILPRDGSVMVGTHAATNKSRSDAWKDIAAMVNSVSDTQRELQEVIKRWRYLKSRTRVKARRLTRFDRPLNELQVRVLNVVGEEEATGNDAMADDEGWDMEGVDYDVTAVNDEEEFLVVPREINSDHSQDNNIQQHNEQSNSQIVLKAEIAQNPPEVSPSHENMDQWTQNESQSGTSGIRRKPRVTAPASMSSSSPIPRHMFPIADMGDTGRRYRNRDSDFQDTMMHGFYNGETAHNESMARTNRERSLNENVGVNSDKSNVNITVQSCCKCDKDRDANTGRIGLNDIDIHRERIEIERQRLKIEKERLQIEKDRLQVEKEKLALEKERLSLMKQNSH